MDWFFTLVSPASADSVTSLQSLVAVFAVITLGTFLGKLSLKGVSLGTAAIMFVGLFMGHLGYTLSNAVFEFLRDFGIILFLYVMGLQVGPFFFSSFQKQGLLYNLFTLLTVLIGIALTVGLYFYSGFGIDTIAGIMSGAVTNTPGMGAAQTTLHEISLTTGKVFSDPASAYAIAYPIGVFGIILVIAASKFLFRIDVEKEIENYTKEQALHNEDIPKVIRCTIQNPQMNGKTLLDIFDILGRENINISRFRRKGETIVEVPSKETVFHVGDTLVIIGLEKDLKYVQPLLGKEVFDMTIEESPDVLTKKMVVTRRIVSGKPIELANMQSLYGVKVTRISRGDTEFVANPQNRLLFGDHVTVVGTEKDLQRFESLIGNNPKYLTESNLLLLTFGLILGIIIGSIPFILPGLASPLKLGIAAGALLVALFISRYAPSFGYSVYMNKGSSSFLKDLGISLFFAVVGLHAGEHFYDTFINNDGLTWILYAFIITTLPLLLMMFVGYYVFRISFLPLMGLLAASYTDSIALLFSTSYFKTDIPNHAYVLTYPMVNIIRIIAAQLMVLFLVI